jgi:hypothetical protein
MPGMSGELDEQPARRSACGLLVLSEREREDGMETYIII